MTISRAPLVVARTGVGLAVRALPTWADRVRYRAEFYAEMYDLPPADQVRYAAGVLSQTFALRAALGAPIAHVEEGVMLTEISRVSAFAAASCGGMTGEPSATPRASPTVRAPSATGSSRPDSWA